MVSTRSSSSSTNKRSLKIKIKIPKRPFSPKPCDEITPKPFLISSSPSPPNAPSRGSTSFNGGHSRGTSSSHSQLGRNALPIVISSSSSMDEGPQPLRSIPFDDAFDAPSPMSPFGFPPSPPLPSPPPNSPNLGFQPPSLEDPYLQHVFLAHGTNCPCCLYNYNLNLNLRMEMQILFAHLEHTLVSLLAPPPPPMD